MKKALKTLMAVVMVGVFAFGALGVVKPHEAAAYEKGIFCNDTSTGSELNRDTELCASQDYYNVTVSMYAYWRNSYGAPLYWRMKLQRYTGYLEWTTVDTRTGYLSTESPSHRTFTNIGQYNKPMRVLVDFYWDSGLTQYNGSIETESFYR